MYVDILVKLSQRKRSFIANNRVYMIFKELISASTKIRTLKAVIARAVRGRSQTTLTKRGG